jgi:hypothetical protein
MHGKGAMIQHLLRKMTHNRLGLDMQVAQHFIRSPSADELDDVSVDLGAQQGSGTCCAHQRGRDVFRKEP